MQGEWTWWRRCDAGGIGGMLADDLTSQDDGPNTRCLPRYGFTVVQSGTAAAGQRRRNVRTNFGTVIAGNQCAEHLYRSTSR